MPPAPATEALVALPPTAPPPPPPPPGTGEPKLPLFPPAKPWPAVPAPPATKPVPLAPAPPPESSGYAGIINVRAAAATTNRTCRSEYGVASRGPKRGDRSSRSSSANGDSSGSSADRVCWNVEGLLHRLLRLATRRRRLRQRERKRFRCCRVAWESARGCEGMHAVAADNSDDSTRSTAGSASKSYLGPVGACVDFGFVERGLISERSCHGRRRSLSSRCVCLQRLREFYSPKLICDSGVRAILYA